MVFGEVNGMNAPHDVETRFAQALAQIPGMPDCYGEIIRRIKRKSAVKRVVWALAASLAISLTSFLYFVNQARQAISPDVAEEIQSIRSHVAGDDIREELVSCSLIGEYME
jgi:hypothetical protein